MHGGSYAAFAGAGGARKDGPNAPEVVKIIQQFVHLAPEQIEPTGGYNDPELRIDEKDVEWQIDGFHARSMHKESVKAGEIIDSRYAAALPGS